MFKHVSTCLNAFEAVYLHYLHRFQTTLAECWWARQSTSTTSSTEVGQRNTGVYIYIIHVHTYPCIYIYISIWYYNILLYNYIYIYTAIISASNHGTTWLLHSSSLIILKSLKTQKPNSQCVHMYTLWKSHKHTICICIFVCTEYVYMYMYTHL